jgi:hypothetical protein
MSPELIYNFLNPELVRRKNRLFFQQSILHIVPPLPSWEEEEEGEEELQLQEAWRRIVGRMKRRKAKERQMGSQGKIEKERERKNCLEGCHGRIQAQAQEQGEEGRKEERVGWRSSWSRRN